MHGMRQLQGGSGPGTTHPARVGGGCFGLQPQPAARVACGYARGLLGRSTGCAGCALLAAAGCGHAWC